MDRDMFHRIDWDLHLRAGALFFFALAVAGCGPIGGGWAAVLGALLWMGALLFGGCGASHPPNPDAEVSADAEVPTDAGGDTGGYWERCCRDGRLSTCYCPAGVACNYGDFIDCGDGTCGYGGDPAMVCSDAGAPRDAGR